MSIAYSTGYVEFIPADKQKTGREYSERSMIELRQDYPNEYSLKALDIENHKTEIFNLPLKEPNMYKFGHSSNDRDEVRCKKGTYRLLLHPDLRDKFHENLRSALYDLTDSNKNPLHNPPDKSHTKKSIKIPREISDQDNILINIHKLIKYVESGKDEKAAALASELASKRVQFKRKTLDTEADTDDDDIQIRVKIDGINVSIDKTNEPCTLKVYKSTTIDELRALFEYVCNFPAAHQYFFINGHLAYAESTMDELNVKHDSLFVLFLAGDPLKENDRL